MFEARAAVARQGGCSNCGQPSAACQPAMSLNSVGTVGPDQEIPQKKSLPICPWLVQRFLFVRIVPLDVDFVDRNLA